MDYTAIIQLILSALTQAPALISDAEAAYNSIKGELSQTDTATIDQALADAKAADATSTAAADAALAAAAAKG